MHSLGVQAPETWIVGDNLEWEVVAPQRLGIYAIWCDPDGKGLPAQSAVKPDRIMKPDRIIKTLSELLPPARATGAVIADR